jgi:hypothetical protein
MVRQEAGRRGLEVQREQPSIHERGGLGREGWELVLDRSRQAQTRTLPPLIPGNLFAYAEGVLAGRIPDTTFAHRAYLDRHDWQEVIRLFKNDTPKRNPIDVAKKRLKVPLATDIKHYAQFEAARAYSIRDHALDQLQRAAFTWNEGSWEKEVSVQGDIAMQPLDGKDYAKLSDIFMLPHEIPITPSASPLELYDILRQQALQQPTETQEMILHILHGIRELRNPGTLIDLPTRAKATNVGPSLAADSTAHFGTPPVTQTEHGLVTLSYGTHLPDGPLVMQGI